ncbi:MAG: DJ-1/PfpI family protein [Bacteroidales bacterium]|nr:DJ-1/PfpI family protein [Bacteroidales bacterium]
MKEAYLFLADGFEDMEALCTVDILRRGGVPVRTVSIYDDRWTVESSHSVSVDADMNFAEFQDEFAAGGASALVFPGGLPGAKYLAEKKELIELMVSHFEGGGLVASICAAPGLVTSQLPGQEGRRFTCYPGCEAIPVSKGAVCTGASVEEDGNLITGRGPGLAMEFGLAILARIKGEAAADAVRKGLLL